MTPRRWSQRITEGSNALDLEAGVQRRRLEKAKDELRALCGRPRQRR
ncbi:MAG: hypothetical protein WCA17_10580 [Burkholderiales bacterium]